MKDTTVAQIAGQSPALSLIVGILFVGLVAVVVVWARGFDPRRDDNEGAGR